MSRIIKVHVGTGYSNCHHEDEVDIPDGWDDWKEKEREDFLNECAMDLLHNNCEASAWVEDK